MSNEYVLTTDGNGDLAIRTVVAEESSTANSTDVITATTDGKLAVRVVGSGGGGDSHNLGWYENPTALNTAHPTAEAGDWAIVGSTDTVWLWDTDTTAWVDSDQKGQVTSVNGQTGAVTVQETLVNQTNIKSVDGNSLLGSGNLELSTYLTYPAGWTTNGTTKAFCDGIAADTTATVGKAYLGEVTLSDLPASMVNAEVVVEIMDGTTAQNKVIVLSLKSGNVAPYAWQYVYWNGGSNVSGWKTWQEPLVSGTNIKTINGTSLLGSGDITTEAIQVDTMPTAAAGELGKVYQFIGTTGTYTHGYFYECAAGGVSVASGTAAVTDFDGGDDEQDLPAPTFTFDVDTFNTYATGINHSVISDPTLEIDITDNDTNWLVEVHYNGNDDSFTVSTSTQSMSDLETALASFGVSVDLTGFTWVSVAYLDLPTATTYDWERIDVQPTPSGLPSQTGHSGEFLTTDGTDASWAAISALQNTATGTASLTILGTPCSTFAGINIGDNSSCSGVGVAIGRYSALVNSSNGAVAVGNGATTRANYAVVVGNGLVNANNAIQLGCRSSQPTNSDANTMKVANANGNYEMMSADGTIPTARLTKVNTTATLTSAGWSGGSQTITVNGVTATGIVFVSPDPTDQAAYTSAGIVCTAQAADSLTFTATSTPASDLTVNVIML